MFLWQPGGAGVVVIAETLSQLSPDLTEHINRFAVYEWNQQHMVSPINYDL